MRVEAVEIVVWVVEGLSDGSVVPIGLVLWVVVVRLLVASVVRVDFTVRPFG